MVYPKRNKITNFITNDVLIRLLNGLITNAIIKKIVKNEHKQSRLVIFVKFVKLNEEPIMNFTIMKENNVSLFVIIFFLVFLYETKRHQK